MNIFTKTLLNIKKAFEGGGADSFSSWIDTYRSTRTKSELLKEYKNLTYACIDAIATDVGKYEMKTYRLKADGSKEYLIHPFKKVLERPNAFMSQFDLFEATQSYLELTGDAFWYLARGQETGIPKEIYMMRPDRVQVAKDSKGNIVGYVFVKSADNKIPLDIDDVIHFKTFNPIDPDYGMGTVQAGMLYIDTENNSAEFKNNFLENQATPSGVLQIKGKITKEAFIKLKRQWKEANSGVGNVGKTLIIRGADADFQKVGLSIADLDMTALDDGTGKKLRAIFKVPKALLGDTDSSGLGRSNIEAIEYIFSKRTIEPKLMRIDDTLTPILRKLYRNLSDIYVDHVSQVPEDFERQLTYNEKAVNRWVTINEVREEEGRDPIEGGDKLYVGFNETPIDAEPVNTSGDQVKSVTVKLAPTTLVKLKKKVEKRLNSAETSFVNAQERLEQGGINPYAKKLSPYLEAQKKRVISVIRDHIGKSGADMNVLTKFIDQVVDEINDKGAIAVLLEKIVKILFGIYQESGIMAIDFLDLPDTEFLTEQAARDAIFTSTERMLKSFNLQTAELIQKQIAAGLAEGLSVDDIAKRIEGIYEDAKGYRAKRIAQTESHKAVNYGTAKAFQQAGIKKMQWYAFPNACEYCERMNGTIVTIGSPFIAQGATIEGVSGGEYLADYEDVMYADLHPHCNCKLLPYRD